MADRVAGAVETLHPDIPACASVPHCDLCVARVRLVANSDSLDDVLHCVVLVVVLYVPHYSVISSYVNPTPHFKSIYFGILFKVVVSHWYISTYDEIGAANNVSHYYTITYADSLTQSYHAPSHDIRLGKTPTDSLTHWLQHAASRQCWKITRDYLAYPSRLVYLNPLS